MTEAEWWASEDPTLMLEHLRGVASDRKFRLFACACCRRFWPLMTDERSRRAVVASEGFAEGLVPEAEFEEARWEAAAAADLRDAGTPELFAAEAACSACWPDFLPAGQETSGGEAYDAARSAALLCQRIAARPACPHLAGHPALAALLRDVFGNPFRPVARNPAWLTPNVVALARTIYDELAFDRLPILADALMDAGCENADVLEHCRSEGLHVRGCWVVDLILGKE